MHRRTARGNRLGIAVLGILLLVGGLALLAANRGSYGNTAGQDPLYPVRARTFVHDNHGWLWPAVAAVAIVLGLLFLRWLLVQPRRDSLRRVRVDSDNHTDGGAGRTTMPATALTDAIEDDLTDVRGVRRATAALSGSSDRPQLWLSVTTDANANLGRIRQHLAQTTIPDAQRALELPELPTYLRLSVGRHSTSSPASPGTPIGGAAIPAPEVIV